MEVDLLGGHADGGEAIVECVVDDVSNREGMSGETERVFRGKVPGVSQCVRTFVSEEASVRLDPAGVQGGLFIRNKCPQALPESIQCACAHATLHPIVDIARIDNDCDLRDGLLD